VAPVPAEEAADTAGAIQGRVEAIPECADERETGDALAALAALLIDRRLRLAGARAAGCDEACEHRQAA
jgi:hypothetical protein